MVMVGRLSLRRLLYALLLFLILICVHFLISVKQLPQHLIEKQTSSKTPVDSYISKKQPVNKLPVTRQTAVRESPTDKPAAAAAAVTTTIGTTTQRAEPERNDLAWFFKGGTQRPRPHKLAHAPRLWPEDAEGEDRIIDQLMYVPEEYDETSPWKKIVLWHGLDRWVKLGHRSFLEAKCPVNRCLVTDQHSLAHAADAILFKDHFVLPPFRRPPQQVWIMYLLEGPYHTERLQYNDLINWTATYRRDSDIVAPYERWVYYDEKVKETALPKRNFAANKTQQVAWFVSNCNAHNGRLNYAQELQKHINVHIYGFCGPHKCPRTNECFHLLDTDYKFYLAFENSNCIDYITEKFFVNSLQHDVLPIVMGARPQDYAAVAPYHSYLHVDDFSSPKELAEYLLKLDYDDDLYNSYFRWKGTGEFINTQFFCRLCAMLHAPPSPRSYRNLNKWWRTVDTCVTSGTWRNKN